MDQTLNNHRPQNYLELLIKLSQQYNAWIHVEAFLLFIFAFMTAVTTICVNIQPVFIIQQLKKEKKIRILL